MKANKWIRYRFKTKSVEDYRPLVFNQKYPWWCSGVAGDRSYATIIAYLPENEKLSKYWNDAFDIAIDRVNRIEFTDRFKKPEWYKEK